MAKRRMGGIIPKVPIGADMTEAYRDVDKFIKDVGNGGTIKIDADISAATGRIERLLHVTKDRTLNLDLDVNKKLLKEALADLPKVAADAASRLAAGEVEKYGQLRNTLSTFVERFKDLSAVVNGKTVSGITTILGSIKDLSAISDITIDNLVSEQAVKNSEKVLKNVKEAAQEANKTSGKSKTLKAKSQNQEDIVKQTLRDMQRQAYNFKRNNTTNKSALAKRESTLSESLNQIEAIRTKFPALEEACNSAANAINETLGILRNGFAQAGSEVKGLETDVVRSTKRQAKATETLADANERLQKAYLNSRKVYEVSYGGGGKHIFPSIGKAQAAVKNYTGLGGTAEIVEKYLGDIEESLRAKFEKLYYQSSVVYKPGDKFTLSDGDFETYIAMIESLEEFKNQFNRLDKLRSRGINFATIKPNRLLLDNLESLLEESEDVSASEIDLLERILTRRTSSSERLQGLLNYGKSDVAKGSTWAKMAEYYDSTSQIQSETQAIEGQSRATDKLTDSASEASKSFDLLNMKARTLKDELASIKTTVKELFTGLNEGSDGLLIELNYKDGTYANIRDGIVTMMDEAGNVVEQELKTFTKTKFNKLLSNVVYARYSDADDDFDTQVGSLYPFGQENGGLDNSEARYLEYYRHLVGVLHKDASAIRAEEKMSDEEKLARKQEIFKYEELVNDPKRLEQYLNRQSEILTSIESRKLALQGLQKVLSQINETGSGMDDEALWRKSQLEYYRQEAVLIEELVDLKEEYAALPLPSVDKIDIGLGNLSRESANENIAFAANMHTKAIADENIALEKSTTALWKNAEARKKISKLIVRYNDLMSEISGSDDEHIGNQNTSGWKISNIIASLEATLDTVKFSDMSKKENMGMKLYRSVTGKLDRLIKSFKPYASDDELAVNYLATVRDVESIASHAETTKQFTESWKFFETPSTQVSMFDGMEDPIVEAANAADKLSDELKEAVKLADQISFDEVSNLVYHAGVLSDLSNTLKSFPLGNVRPYKSEGVFTGLTGLYTTEDLAWFQGNEWTGAPMSTIDVSQYKLFDAKSNELATKVMHFFDNLNGTIYGYIDFFDHNNIESDFISRSTDVKSIEDLYKDFTAIFHDVNMGFEQFSKFITNAKSIVAGYDFKEIDMPAIDEGIAKSGSSSALQGVSDEIFYSDSFQTQLLKILGYEGIDLRGTKYNGTYTGGTVLFDIKPGSLLGIDEKFSDVMTRNGYEVGEYTLADEERRRQLAFDTAKAYRKQSQEQLAVEKQITAEKEKQNELVAIHGLSMEHLKDAITKGAFPSPSVAVTKPDVYAGGYGDATVVFKKSAIDPAQNPANKIYGVDAYTPTHPSFGYELDTDGLIRASERTGLAIESLRHACDGAYENITEAAGVLGFSAGIEDALKEAYVKERGIAIGTSEIDEAIKNRFHVFDEEINNSVRDFIARDDVTFDAIVNDDKIQKEYFDAIDKYVEDTNKYFEDFTPGQIKPARVEEAKNEIIKARIDPETYAEEKELFEHDQAVIRGQLKTVDKAARFHEISKIISENREDYSNYVESVLADFMVKPNVKGAKGQRFDRTPDGIAAAMASYGGKNALYDEDPFMRRDMDDQLFIIGSAKDYKSFEEVIADSDRLQKDAIGTHTQLEHGYIKGLARVIAEANNVDVQEAFDKINQAVDGNTTAEAIGKALKNSGLVVGDDIVKQLSVSAHEAANVPTRYFEAKPQRAVGIDEIEFVSLPSDSALTPDMKEMLSNLGIKVVEHISDDMESRAKALRDGMQQVNEMDAMPKLVDGIKAVEASAESATAANQKLAQSNEEMTATASEVAHHVGYHAGSIGRLNKAETNGRFYGSNRGTGYYGTGYYFVDQAHKRELDQNNNYNKLPYTSIDLSQYTNLFKADTDEKASKLHTFLKNLTRYTQDNDLNSLDGLFAEFQKVFGESVLTFDEFGNKARELTDFMQQSSLDDRSDSVSTRFMKSLGYGGVDTSGTHYANTEYGIVLYELQEAAVLQANITDEIQKQGDMLKKIDYAPGEVYDKDIDAKIQSRLDEQKRKQEYNAKVAAEFNKLYDGASYDKLLSDLNEIEQKLANIDEQISSINDKPIELKKLAKDFDLDDMDDVIADIVEEEFDEKRLTDLESERDELLKQKEALVKRRDAEQPKIRAAYEKAQHNVEASAQAAAKAQEKLAQANEEVATASTQAANNIEINEQALREFRGVVASDMVKLPDIRSDGTPEEQAADYKAERDAIKKAFQDHAALSEALKSKYGNAEFDQNIVNVLSGFVASSSSERKLGAKSGLRAITSFANGESDITSLANGYYKFINWINKNGISMTEDVTASLDSLFKYLLGQGIEIIDRTGETIGAVLYSALPQVDNIISGIPEDSRSEDNVITKTIRPVIMRGNEILQRGAFEVNTSAESVADSQRKLVQANIEASASAGQATQQIKEQTDANRVLASNTPPESLDDDELIKFDSMKDDFTASHDEIFTDPKYRAQIETVYNQIRDRVASGAINCMQAFDELTTAESALYTSMRSDAEQVTKKVRKLSNQEYSKMLKGVDLEKFFKDNNVRDVTQNEIRDQFVKLGDLILARDEGVSTDDEVNAQIANIVSNMQKAATDRKENASWALVNELRKYSQHGKIHYTDNTEKGYGKTEFKDLKGLLKGLLTPDPYGKGVKYGDAESWFTQLGSDLQTAIIDIFQSAARREWQQSNENILYALELAYRKANEEGQYTELGLRDDELEYVGQQASELVEKAVGNVERLLDGERAVTQEMKHQNAEKEKSIGLDEELEGIHDESDGSDDDTVDPIVKLQKEADSLIKLVGSAAGKDLATKFLSGITDGSQFQTKLSEYFTNLLEGDTQWRLKKGKGAIVTQDDIAMVHLFNEATQDTLDLVFKLEDGMIKLAKGPKFGLTNTEPFDLDGAKKLAEIELRDLKANLGGRAYDGMAKLETSLDNITDPKSLEEFNKQLEIAKAEVKALKKEYAAGSGSMNDFSRAGTVMRNAEENIEKLRDELTLLGDVDGVERATDALERMSAATEKFKTSTDEQGQKDAYQQYNEAFADYRTSYGRAQQAKRVSDANEKDEAKQLKEEQDKIVQYYNNMLDAVNKINALDAEINAFKLKDGGSGLFTSRIEGLESDRKTLLAKIDQIGIDIYNAFQGVFKSVEDGKKIELPIDDSVLGETNVGSVISNFFNDENVRNALPTEQIDKFIQSLKNSSNIKFDLFEKIAAQLKPVYDALQELDKISDPSKKNSILGRDSAAYKKIVVDFNNLLMMMSDTSAAGLDKTQKAAKKLVQDISNTIKAARQEAEYFSGKTKYTTGATLYQDPNLTLSTNVLGDDAAKKASENFDSARKKLEKFVNAYAEGHGIVTKFTTAANGISQINFSVIDENTGRLRTFVGELDSAGKAIYHFETTANNTVSGADMADKAMGSIDKALEDLYRMQAAGVDVGDSIEKLKQHMFELGKARMDGAEDGILRGMADSATKAIKEVEKLKAKWEKTKAGIENGDLEDLGTIDKTGNVYEQMYDKIKNSAHGASISNAKFDASTNTLTYTLATADGVVKKMTASLDAYTGTITTHISKVGKMESIWGSFAGGFGDLFGDGIRYIDNIIDVASIVGALKRGFGVVKEIDTALTELKKVTDATDATYANFLQNMSKTGAVVGSTVSELTQSAADWGRLGYSIEEAGRLAENTMILMNVSEFDNVTDATDTLISAIQAFRKEGTDVGTFSMDIIDQFNTIGNSYAISTSDLAESLTRSSAALVAANNSLEQSVALTTAGNTISQNPEAVGNALKTVSMRIRGVKTELEAAGEETDGMVTNTAKLQEKIMALTNIDGKGGINILTDSGEFKSTYDILLGISKVWKDMDDVSQAALLELVAGKNRASIVAGIFQNGDILEDAYRDALGSDGSAQKELDTYLNSIQGKLDQLSNSTQTMWMNIMNSDIVGVFIEATTAVVNFANKVGSLPAAFGGLMGLKTIIQSIRTDFKAIDDGTFDRDIFGFQKMKASSEAAKDAVKEVSNAISEQTEVKNQNTDATNKGVNAGEKKATSDAVEAAMEKASSVATGQDTAKKELNTAATWKQVAAEKALAVAKGIVKGLAITAITFAASAAISGLISVVTSAANRMNDLTDAALDSADNLDDLRDSTNDYKSKIQSLRDVLADNNATEQEAYDARAQLIDIQNQLIDKFGLEAQGINLVTGAINEQIAAIDGLTQQAATDWYNDNLEAYRNAIKEVEKQKDNDDFVFATENTQTNPMTQVIETTYRTLNDASQEVYDQYITGLTRIIESAGGKVKPTKISTTEGFDTYSTTSYAADFEDKTIEELDAVFAEMQTFINKFTSDTGFDLNNQLIQLAKLRNKYNTDDYKEKKELYDKGRQNEAYSKYAKEYGEILAAEEEYYQATTDEERLKALENYGKKVQAAQDKAAENQNQEHMENFFGDMGDKFAEQEYELKIRTNDDALRTNLEKIIKESGEKGLTSLDDVLIKDMIDRGLNVEGATDASGQYTQEQISGLVKLQAEADKAGISIESLIATLVNLGLISGQPVEGAVESVRSLGQVYSTLAESAEKYTNITSVLNEITYDNVEITEDQYNSIKELIGSEEEFAECVDTSNGYIVTNVKLLKDLTKIGKKNEAENVRLSKSQAQLQYYELVKQLGQTLNASKNLSNGNRDAAYSLLEQIDAVKSTIQQYQMLEDTLLGTTNAFEKFAAAQEMDAQNTYGDSYVEMAQAMYDALYKTGEVGTEQFWAATEALIPADELNKFEAGAERIQEVYEYFNKNILPTLTLTDDKFELDFDAIENFVEKAQEANIFTQTGTDSFEFSQEFLDGIKDGTNGLTEFAKRMGMTETQAYAMLAAFEKYNTDDSELPMISQMDKTTAGKVALITNELERLNEQKLALLQDGGYDEHGEELKKIDEQIKNQTNSYDELREKSHSTWVTYAETETAIDALQDVEDKAQKFSEEQAIKLGVEWEENMTVEDALKQLEERKANLEQPTTLTAQLASEQVQSEIEQLEKNLESSGIDIEANIKLNDEGYYEVNGDVNNEQLQTLASLYNEQQSLETFLTTGLTTAESFLSSIESVLNEINGKIPDESTTSEEDPKDSKSSTHTSDSGVLHGGAAGRSFGDVIVEAESATISGDDGAERLKQREERETSRGYTASESGISVGQAYIDPATLNGSVKNAAAAINDFAAATQNGASEIEGATVDLENRPVIDSTTMQQAGWKDFEDGDLATVYSSAYSNEDESKTIVLTPILPDGQVLSPEQLQNYANQLLNGEELDPGINIKLAEFDGEDSIQLANEFAQTLHETRAALVDPLGINNIEVDLISFMNTLDELGVKYDSGIGTWFDGKTDIEINVPDLVTTLKSKGWTDGAIQSYIQQLSTDLQIEGVNIQLEGIETVDDTLAELNEAQIDGKNVDVVVSGADDAKGELQAIDDAAKDITHTVTTIYKSQYQSVGGTSARLPGSGGRYTMSMADGTAHVNGTAYSNGDFGAPKTEEALGGELGPEMRVRNGRWELIGQNGAEFFDVKKGDIIFNHKQTEELLKNGYVTGRGRAYAGGTVGGAAYSGLWNPTSPDKSLSNTAGSEIGNAASKLSKAAKDIQDSAEEFSEVFDWIEVRLEEINEKISLKSAQLENKISISSKNAVIDDMIELNQKLYDNLTAGAKRYNEYAAKLLKNIPAAYRKAAQDGSIAIESFTGEVGEQTLEAIQNYREWVQKGSDATQQAEETLTEISNLAKQAIDNIVQGYENKTSIPRFQIEQLEAYNSLIETTAGSESAQVYNEIIERNNEIIGFIKNQRNKMQAEFNAQVEAGNIKKYSQAWYDAVNDIAAVDTEIIELTTDTEDYQDAINELHWDHFDNLMSRLEAVSDESENLIDILGSKDLVNKDTTEWTDQGVTSLALYAQQMEVAEVQAQKYADEITYLNKNWKKLGYTEQEYVEKLDELKNGQYDAIKSYNDTKEAIKDLTSERVDAIKKGIEKEIESYEELISKKKEELDAEKDLYDFQRGVADQQKEIADIERKLAALSADNSASARAQRAQLQAELAKAQQELQDTYYDRSVSDQQEALDKELENFREVKDKEIEGWDEYLENTEQVVSDALTTIQSNTGIVYQTLLNMGEEYSLSIADAIVSPWADGEVAIQNYSEQFKLSMSSTIEELQKLATEYKKVMSEIEGVGQEAVIIVSGNASRYVNDSSSSAQKLNLPKYAKGTKGAQESQLALIDELGEELVLRPHNGRLSFMEKGTSVIPADLTENLMEWGELDPSVMLERNRPEIKLHPEVHNTEVNITMDIAEVVHVDRVDNENMPDLTKAVEKQLDKYMKNLNNQIRRYVR